MAKRTPAVNVDELEGARQLIPLLALLEHALTSRKVGGRGKFSDPNEDQFHKYVGWEFLVGDRRCSLGLFFDEPEAIWFEVQGLEPEGWKRHQRGWYGTPLPLSGIGRDEDAQLSTVGDFVEECIGEVRDLA